MFSDERKNSKTHTHKQTHAYIHKIEKEKELLVNLKPQNSPWYTHTHKQAVSETQIHSNANKNTPKHTHTHIHTTINISSRKDG